MSNKGFTLLEILIAICLFYIILAFGFNPMRGLYEKFQVKRGVNLLQTALLFSRNQAFTSHYSLILSPLADKWADGFMLAEADDYSKEVPKALQIWQMHTPGLKIQWRGFYPHNHLSFNQDLRRNAINGTFTVAYAAACTQIIVNRYGGSRVQSCSANVL
jgi:prepilin-type N-terminal cleavage/methylation domain-containing protein